MEVVGQLLVTTTIRAGPCHQLGNLEVGKRLAMIVEKLLLFGILFSHPVNLFRFKLQQAQPVSL